MTDYNDNKEFWTQVYNWVAEWFYVYENAAFTTESIYEALIRAEMIAEDFEIPTFEQFENNFHDWIGNYRDYDFADKYFVETSIGWVYTSKSHLLMESIKFLEDKLTEMVY